MIGVSREKLITCLQIMLSPVARFCARHSIHVNEINEAFKRALVSAAEQQIVSIGKRPTASRIKAMVGLHRREISRLLSSSEIKEGKEGFITRIIGQWQHDKRFSSRPGKPKALSYKGENNEFGKLVRTVNLELKPGTILFELERLGVLKKQDNMVSLDIGSYTPLGNVEELVTFLAKDASDLMDAVSENIFTPSSPPNLHATTEYDNVDPAAADQIRKWLIAQGKSFHQRAREFLSKFDRDIFPTVNRQSDGVRVAIGTFGLVRENKSPAKAEKKP